MQMCKMQKCMVTCKPLPFLDIESFCLLDNPVLWHTRPIKVTPTWRSRFIPLNWDTHSVSLVWKRGWKWAKITTEFFFNQTVRKVVSYRDLALSQSTVTLIPCVMFLKGNRFEQKAESKYSRNEYTSWTCEKMSIVCNFKVWHSNKFFFKSMFGRSRKRTVTPYDDITEGLKGIYKQRLLPLEKVKFLL